LRKRQREFGNLREILQAIDPRSGGMRSDALRTAALSYRASDLNHKIQKIAQLDLTTIKGKRNQKQVKAYKKTHFFLKKFIPWPSLAIK